MQTFFIGRFSKEVYNNFEPILEPLYTHILLMIYMYNFAWQIISNYLTPPPKKNKFLIIIISQSFCHSSRSRKSYLPLLIFHTVVITSGLPLTQ